MPGAQNRFMPSFQRISLGSLTLTATNESLRAKTVSGITVAVLQNNFMSASFGRAEVWRPVGLIYIVTTGITVTDAVVQLWKNGAAVHATGGKATLAIVAAAVNELFAAFTDYGTLTGDAAGDAWSVKVTTTSTAGVASLFLVVASVPKAGVTEGEGAF